MNFHLGVMVHQSRCCGVGGWSLLQLISRDMHMRVHIIWYVHGACSTLDKQPVKSAITSPPTWKLVSEGEGAHVSGRKMEIFQLPLSMRKGRASEQRHVQGKTEDSSGLVSLSSVDCFGLV